jgi:flagellar FliL protein
MTTANEEGSAVEGGKAPPRQLSTFHFILIVAVLTLAAAGVGVLSGLRILSSAQESVASKGVESPQPLGGLQHVESANLKTMTPIVTNLAGSPPVWIRLEASLVFHDNPKDADALAARISEDIVGFLRTVSVAQIEGAIGFQHLSEDLNDRVRVRSNGRVQELVIQGLIIE